MINHCTSKPKHPFIISLNKYITFIESICVLYLCLYLWLEIVCFTSSFEFERKGRKVPDRVDFNICNLFDWKKQEIESKNFRWTTLNLIGEMLHIDSSHLPFPILLFNFIELIVNICSPSEIVLYLVQVMELGSKG